MEDAGAFIPMARKHLAQKRGSQTTKQAALRDLWPEEDWQLWIDGGRTPECVAHIAMLYSGLAKSPKKDCWDVSSEEWAGAYAQAVPMIRDFCLRCFTLDDFRRLASRLAEACGATRDTISRRPIRDSMIFYAAGRGSTRTLFSPTQLTFRQAHFAKWLPKLGWPASTVALDAGIVPVWNGKDRWHVGRFSGDGINCEAEDLFSDEASAVAEAIRRANAEMTGVAQARRRPGGAQRVRVGPESLWGEDVTTQELMGTFGLRGVQFGESLSHKEAQSWVNSLYEAMSDLADVLGVPPKWIGLGGLGVAVGARGNGRGAAHYEPALKVFNFTRENGAGAFAHEWAHALDHRLGRKLLPGVPDCTWMLSEVGNTFDFDQTSAAVRAVVDRCRYDRSGARAQRSQFFQQAQALEGARNGGGYWTSAPELFARAFEAAIEDQLAAMGRCSPYLASGTRPEDYSSSAHCPYPIGADRLALGELVTGLAAAMRSAQAKVRSTLQ